jgi:hypothetical protein
MKDLLLEVGIGRIIGYQQGGTSIKFKRKYCNIHLDKTRNKKESKLRDDGNLHEYDEEQKLQSACRSQRRMHMENTPH